MSEIRAATGRRALARQVLLYAGNNERILTRASSLGSGVVLHGGAGFRIARQLRKTGFNRPLLVDPERYVRLDKSQRLPISDLELDVNAQTSVKVDAFLSPCAAPARDSEALTGILRDGEKFVDLAGRSLHVAPAYVVVVIGPTLLKAEPERLVEVLNETDLPVALVFASTHDPLATRDAVSTARALVRRSSSTIILRCDLSTIGLVAAGAAAGAIGESSATRHAFVPMRRSNSERELNTTPYVLLRRFLSWTHASELAHLEDPGGYFDCACRVCNGRSILRFRDQALFDEADAHSIAAWQEMADAILSTNSEDDLSAWLKTCRDAEFAFDSYEADSNVALRRPGYLAAWLASS